MTTHKQARCLRSVNGWFNHLPVKCKCGHAFHLELAQDVKIKPAKKGLHHQWYVTCPKCRADAVVVWPSNAFAQCTNPTESRKVCGIDQLARHSISTPSSPQQSCPL